ncbi:hypothetical protein [Sulfurimonas diazotrophicus]|uniref:PIN domain-containing protein n=1 Tax=Sulfurimonas diazotrophicus TaxID=3131939 RepID=A0ABZ3H8Z8_9BACT
MNTFVGNIDFLLDSTNSKTTPNIFDFSCIFVTPNLVFVEELLETDIDFLQLGLKVFHLSADSMTYVSTLSRKCKLVSIYDLYSLALAKQENIPIVSDCKAVLSCANAEDIAALNSTGFLHFLCPS